MATFEEHTPAIPRPAATVILMRDEPDGKQPDIFMVERTARAHFGGMHVFPGGKVDPADAELESICTGIDDTQASALLGLEQGGLAYWVACIRECFEEAGLLLALDSSGRMLELSEASEQKHYAHLRAQLNAGEITFAEICQSQGLKLATDRLSYCSHWITPEAEKKRFDTRFFIAAAPATQHAVHDGSETISSCWLSATSALAGMAAGDINMIPPTFMNLRSLVDFADTASALEHFQTLSPGSVQPITPRIFKDSDGGLKLEINPETVLDLGPLSARK